jgi:hypothetical protein
MRGVKAKYLREAAAGAGHADHLFPQRKNNPNQALTSQQRHTYQQLKKVFSKGVKP